MSNDDSQKFAQGLGQLLAAFGGQNGHYFRHTNDPTEALAYVHYSDRRFNYPGSVIYGRDAADLTWVDSWNLPRDEAVWKRVQEELGLPDNSPLTAQLAEARLRITLDNPSLVLVAVRGFSDPASGYGHYVYGYRIGG